MNKFKVNDIIERKDIFWRGFTEARISIVDDSDNTYTIIEKGERFIFPFKYLEESWEIKHKRSE